MLFNTQAFGLFLLAVCLLSWTLFRRHRGARHTLLLIASYGFYMSWSVHFAALLAFSTVLDFSLGRALHRTERPTRRRMLVGLSLVSNLGILGIFKYYDFFLGNLNLLLAAVGLPPSNAFLNIAVPLGISFYTFQTLSYTIDVYRRRIQPTDRWLDFALYVSFFPQLVAGPIVRASQFLPQLREDRPGRDDDVRAGLYRLLKGLIKKVAIADNLGRLIVDPVFADPATANPTAVVLASGTFMIQLYYDFSGYTDMAIGSARLLGFRLPENFERPFRATSVTAFWRRWHISLTSWVRDYVYFPLARAATRPRPMRNLLIAMVLIGFWHGAAWTFVLFGMFHGAVLALEYRWERRGTRAQRRARARQTVSVFGRNGKRLATFIVVVVSGLLFRAQSLEDVAILSRQLVDPSGGFALHCSPMTLVLLLAAVGLQMLPQRPRAFPERLFVRAPAVAQAATLLATLGLAQMLQDAAQPFVYFAF